VDIRIYIRNLNFAQTTELRAKSLDKNSVFDLKKIKIISKNQFNLKDKILG